MKVYEAVFKEDGTGVHALSVVEDPAMEDVWITLNKQPIEMDFTSVDEEKRILLGAALIPDKKIYRNINGEEFYVTFTKEVIEQAAHSFIKQGFQSNSTENHESKLDGVSVVETWMVADTLKDKSAVYGKKYAPGTWVTMMHVSQEADDIWQKAKSGKLTGFSIEGLFGLKEIQLNKQVMTTETIKQAVLEALNLSKKEEIKMGQLKLKDGKTVLEFEGDAPEVGMPIFVLAADAENKERIAAPEGKHELETGEFLHVDKNSLVADAPEENVGVTEKEVEEQMVLASKTIVDEVKSYLDTKLSEMETAFDVKLKVETDKVEKLEVELAKEPAEKKIVKTELEAYKPKNARERILQSIQKNKN